MVNCNNSQVTRITVAIVCILASKIPTSKTSQLGVNGTYMKFLVDLLKAKVANFTDNDADQNGEEAEILNQANDYTLKFTLSALWNLSGINSMDFFVVIRDVPVKRNRKFG